MSDFYVFSHFWPRNWLSKLKKRVLTPSFSHLTFSSQMGTLSTWNLILFLNRRSHGIEAGPTQTTFFGDDRKAAPLAPPKRAVLKALKMSVIHVAFFILSWTPYTVIATWWLLSSIADSVQTEYCPTFLLSVRPCVRVSQAWHLTFLTYIKA